MKLKIKSFIFILLVLLICYFIFSFYRIMTFDLFENVSSREVVLVEASNDKYVGKLYYLERGANSIGKTAIFLTMQEKATGKVFELLSSDYIKGIEWLSQDSLEVILSKYSYVRMKDYSNDRIVVVAKIQTDY